MAAQICSEGCLDSNLKPSSGKNFWTFPYICRVKRLGETVSLSVIITMSWWIINLYTWKDKVNCFLQYKTISCFVPPSLHPHSKCDLHDLNASSLVIFVMIVWYKPWLGWFWYSLFWSCTQIQIRSTAWKQKCIRCYTLNTFLFI